MPTVRYQIRGEYGLADPGLYREADKEDPEALLEGVAMAGLVGVLRQLGDLAQFAAEIFHDLHEEVMATASRGHGLMLRVQQLEAEFPLIERAFLAQTNPSRFAYNAGIGWHANLQVDQNLVTRGDMPRFILDSYEDCRGPPRLFMLDKFDVAGAGACLKRYSDPSSFKVELAASGKMEPEVQRDNKARKVKQKRGSRWRNGEAAESFLAPRIDSNLQTITSAKVPTWRVKLKNRNLIDSDISSRRSYLEHLIEANTPEQTVLLENSISDSNTIIQSTNSSESAPQVREIMIDNAADSPKVKEGTPVQSPTKQEEALSPLNELDYQKLNVEEISERVPELSDDVQKSYRTSYIVEQKVVLANLDKKTEACLDDYGSSEAEENFLASKEVDQKKSFLDNNLITEGGNDDYRSEDIGSELDNYMDALNTMELEIETDTESKAKSDPGFSHMEYQHIVSGINENQQDLTASSELNSVDNFIAPLGLNSVLKNGTSSPSNSNSLGSLHDAQPPQGNMSSSEMPSNPEIGLWEIHDKPSQRNGESVQLVSLAHSHTSETYNTKESDIASSKSETGVTSSYSYSPMDVHSQGTNELRSVSIQPNDSPRHIHSQGSDKVQTVSIQPNESYSTYVEGTHEVTELSDGKILQVENMRIENIFELPSGTHDTVEEHSSLDSNSDFSDGLLNLSDVEGASSQYCKDQIPDDRGETFEIPDHLSEPKEEYFLEEAPKLYVEGSLPTLTVDIKGDGKESTEQETKDSSGGITSLKTSAFSPKVISTVMQPEDVVADIDAVEQREDLAKDISDYVIDTHEVAEPLDSELPCNAEITELLSQANDDKAFPRRPVDSCISSDSPLIAFDTPENLHSKEDDAKQITENMADALGDRVLEVVATEHVEESPTSFTVEVGDAEESMEQYKVDTSSANSGLLVEASPIVMQSDGILIEMENSVAPSEGIVYSELVAGNANETEGKILMRNEVTDELEHFSDVVIQESWSVEFMEPLPMPSGDEIIPDDKQLHSEEPAWVVIDRSEAVGENMELPSEFTVSSLHEDSTPCEKLPYDDNSLAENVTVKADVSNHDPCPVYSSEVSGFVQELLEDCFPDDAVLGQHKREISDVSSPKDTTSLYFESNLCMAVLPQIEDQPISSPVSSSELTDSSDSKLSPGISQMISAEHSQRDFCPNVHEENPISSPESEDPGCAEGMSPPSTCLLREPAVPLVEASVLKNGNQQNEACSHQKVDNLESNGLQSQIAYTDEGNIIRSNSEDLHDKPSDQGPEPDNGSMDDSCTPPSICQLVDSSTSVEEASKSEAADEPNTVSSNQEGDLLQASNLQSERTNFDEQKSIQSDADSHDDEPLEPGAEPDCGNVIESDTPPSSAHNPEELKPEPLVPPGCISDLSVVSLASCISTSVLSPNASSDLAIAKTSPQDPSQQQLGESISSFQIQDVDETPPPPPLPPLQWRTGKLWLGSSTLGGNAVQPPSGTNPFMSPASIDEKHSQESVTDGREVLPADTFAPLSVWEDERFQHGSFASEGTIDQPVRLSNLPLIVEGERYQDDALFVEADMTHSSDSLLGVSNSPPIEDDKHSCCGDAPPPPLQILTPTPSYLPEEDQVQAMQGRRPELGQLVQSLELQRSQHEASVVERAPVLPLNPFLVTSPMEDWQHQYGYGAYGGESLQHLNLSAPLPIAGATIPLPIAGATIPQYGFMYPMGENPSTFYDIMVPIVEGERPKWKHRSIRDRPRDPLIEAVAAHDKSTLRKVSELDKLPAKSKVEERDTLLEQIRKKSFSLKPAGVTKPNIKGPATNLKVSAILEKANAIRQAFAGSDEDDDGDSWSDS